jgi:hypothetical protein
MPMNRTKGGHGNGLRHFFRKAFSADVLIEALLNIPRRP